MANKKTESTIIQKEKAYIYTRVSTSMQVEGFSLSAQESDIRRYAQAYGLEIAGQYCDEGLSGKNDKRPQFKQMIKDIKEKKDNVRYVLVFKLSRFARNAADTLKNLQLMKDNGVDLICIKEGLNSSTATGKMMLTIMSAVAEMELENIHTQTMAGRRQKAREGKWNGGFAPYGYKLKDGMLEIVEEEAKTVRYIFELFTTEMLGAMAVAKRLNSEGIKKIVRQNGTKETFTSDFIKKILDNPVYMGKIAYGRRKTEKVDGDSGRTHIVKETNADNIIMVDGIHKAIVTEEQWNSAHKKRLETGVHKEKLEQDHEYVLSGLIKCPSCESKLYGVPNRKKKPDGTYYKVSYAYKCRQSKKLTGIDCKHSKQYNCKEIDDEFCKAIALCFLTPEIIEALTKKLNEEFDISEVQNKLDGLLKRQKELISIQNKYETEQSNLDVTDKHYDRKFQNYTKQLDKIYDQLDEIESLIYVAQIKINDVVATKKSKTDAMNMIIEFGCCFDELSPKSQKQLANLLVDSIEIFPDKRDMGYLKTIHFKIPVFTNNGLKTDVTVWDNYPDILDENGKFNGYSPEDELPERDLLKERADENGNIVVVEEYGKEEQDRLMKLRLKRINEQRKAKGLQEITEEQYLKLCRPKQITDESVALLTLSSDITP